MSRFKRVFIANRGEIAVRIIRACRDLGLESVAVYSDADRNSMHRQLADVAIHLPGNTSAETYLDIDKIMAAIKLSQADAVHPGYGFLAENASFAKTLLKAGICFIGPSPEAMESMGDKVKARAIMSAAKVPTVPGTPDPIKSESELKAFAEQAGYPVILKAAAGGGGRGMRVVRKAEELAEAYAACQREAMDYFSNDDVFCEKYIEKGRHIEFQVLFDEHGNGIHLFERDCSVQRRHQKLLEEAPSTFLSSSDRENLGKIALQAGKAVNYTGVGTVEFICESPQKCYFMEMNTRIQVEHPVTEMITGVDLICEQIKVALGQKLSLTQDDIKLNGWAIETRINAEDPTKDFAPGPGLVKDLHLPSGPFVRVDSHLYPGYEIPQFYDSMIAKVITWGSDRSEALKRMRRALSEMRVSGVPTTAKFHEAVFADDDFLKGNFYTSFVGEKQNKLLQSVHTPSDKTAASILAAILSQENGSQCAASTRASEMRTRWTYKARQEASERTT